MELQETSILPINLFHPAPQTGAKKNGASCGSRTHDLLITSQLLWPTELSWHH